MKYVCLRLLYIHMLISLIVLLLGRSTVLSLFPTKNLSALWSSKFSDSGSRSYACIMGTMEKAKRNNELCGICRTIPISFAHRYTAYSVCGMRKRQSSRRRFTLSNRIPRPPTIPAAAGIHGDRGGGRCWKLRNRQMTYFVSSTMVARKAVDIAVFFSRRLIKRFGLQRKRSLCM